MEAQSSQLNPQRKLKILLDARKLGDGGIGVYIDNLIQAFLENKNIELSLIVKNSSQFKNLKQIEVIADKAKSYSLDEMFGLASRINFKNFDLFHVPHFTLPYRVKIPSVITVHDLIHINQPQRKFYPILARPLIASAVKRAQRVIVDSRATFKELENFAPRYVNKFRHIACGLNPNFIKTKLDVNYFENKFSRLLKGPYILAVVSNNKPHKRLYDLVNAYRNIKSELAGLQLVIVTSQRIQFDPDIICLSNLASKDLVHLYAFANFLVVPSIAEGFCLPALEAKAWSTPVVARPVPAICELLDQNDLICQDMSLVTLQKTILQMAAKNHAGYARKNIAIIEQYDYLKTAAQVEAVYRELV